MNEELRQLRIENKLLREDGRSVDAVDALTEEGWIWDGDQWQRPPELNQFKPDWNTEAVLVEEMQRMAKVIAEQDAILRNRAEQIVSLQDEIRNLMGEA